MMFFRCLRCDSRIHLRKWYGKKISIVECGECQAAYDYNYIKESDPVLWERMRANKNFTQHPTNPRILYIPQGLGLNPKLEKRKDATSSRR
jgi:Zn ribbon nucleic-acid-binding protein